MFQFARLLPLHLWIQCRVPAHYHGWVSPFGNPRIKARSAAPRGLSQPSTSFIGSWCQGIHRVPLFSCCLAELLERTPTTAMQFSRCARDDFPLETRQPASRAGRAALARRSLKTEQCERRPHECERQSSRGRRSSRRAPDAIPEGKRDRVSHSRERELHIRRGAPAMDRDPPHP